MDDVSGEVGEKEKRKRDIENIATLQWAWNPVVSHLLFLKAKNRSRAYN